MIVRTLITSICIGKEIFREDLSFSLSHSLNENRKIASIQLRSRLSISGDKLATGLPCQIFLTNENGKTKIFSGVIGSSSQSGNTYTITAIQNIIPDEDYHETFQDSPLKDIMKSLGNIRVESLNKEFPQFILEGKKLDSFTRIIQNLEDLLGMNIYYSIYDDEIVVRESPILEKRKTFDQLIVHEFRGTSMDCFPIVDAQVGDEIVFEKKKFLITGITSTNRQQSLSLLELGG
ncbi:MAG: hypothetical protein ACRCS8_02070 [Brevinema sp.]